MHVFFPSRLRRLEQGSWWCWTNKVGCKQVHYGVAQRNFIGCRRGTHQCDNRHDSCPAQWSISGAVHAISLRICVEERQRAHWRTGFWSKEYFLGTSRCHGQHAGGQVHAWSPSPKEAYAPLVHWSKSRWTTWRLWKVTPMFLRRY